jgi:hypothetical protein
VAGETVGRGLGVVAVDETVGDELVRDRLEGGEPAWVGRGDELDQRHQQHRGVEHAGVEVLDERGTILVPAAVHDLALDPVAGAAPACAVGGEAALVGDPQRALDCHPAHQP